MTTRTGDIVGKCTSLAALLEVSAYPKPGNVHRLRDSPNTKYEHFLAGSVSLYPRMRELAEKSLRIRNEDREWTELGVGESILASTKDMMDWQSGGNVHLGIILLFSPLAAAAGSVMREGVVDLEELRGALNKVISGAIPIDAVNIYRAIDEAMSKENLGAVDQLDVKDTSSLDKILAEGLTPLDIFRECQARDAICKEWATGFNVTFTEGYPFLRKRLDAGASINEATVDTFLKILSEHPDSLIQRKLGKKDAIAVSVNAKEIIQAGGASTEIGMTMIWELDDELRKENGSLNPGTTADLTAASLFLILLTGWRP
ncbi:ATP--dephospho-CoA triphosphoribosyl transferase CitG [Candidatus Bathyarchaeota archaeon]|nr:ATP--dephospho-CoA triphosphoribosyl transferase CitG [Candidatus Bathyarchaeota archaeon]MBT6605410.1 ATP--dephospho-CoA triphosphoribosyl transferase CitG [Candidatus Bathyarchaeota archaeon]MBT7186365.1 ATP--dephospho-CoA triphosphoribosyl transferase CitG [Candidatus Bathyarchaeota archaeon]MBT7915818.1 ATP--dephospho-CoA triphosphoribosyl transferase CitG [Candidatus Bathyarchaeota archaeon]